MSRLFAHSGVNAVARRAHKHASGYHYTILTYHRVLNVANIQNYEFDENLISANTDQFSRQISFLKDHYNVISFRSLFEAIGSGRKLPGNTVIITFDDGFLDNYVNAYPVLKRHAVTATFFISTDYIGKERYFWFDELVYFLKKVDLADMQKLMDSYCIQYNNTGAFNRGDAIRCCMRFVKRTDNGIRLQFIEKLKSLNPSAGPDAANKSAQARYLNIPMTWEQLREMSAGGIEFGSHTMSHPILANLNDDDLFYELNESHRLLSTAGINYFPVLAYPVGGEYAFNAKVKSMANQIGYKLACSYMPGVNNYSGQDRYAIRRMSVESYMPIHYVSSMLALPKLFLR